MRIIMSEEEICILKKIARKARKVRIGYMLCLNCLASACGYDDWDDLNSNHKIGLAS